MTPPEVVTLLNEGLAAVVTVAGMVFVVIVGIAAFKYMRRAVGGGCTGPVWVDSKGNEYLTEKDADEADARTSGIQIDIEQQRHEDQLRESGALVWVASEKFDDDAYDEYFQGQKIP